MNATRPNGAFTGGDPVSGFLAELAAGRAEPVSGEIPSRVLELSQQHGLVPILAGHTQDLVVRAALDRETIRREALRNHLSQILERLYERGLRIAVLKGPSIAERYRVPSHRPFSDLDLLVPKSELEDALDVLATYPATMRIPEKRPTADKRDILLVDRHGIRFNVDLHWDLFSYTQLRASAIGATEVAWESAVDRPDSRLGPLWDIPDSYRIAFLCAHAILDHRFRVILFRDFLEISRAHVDWESLGQMAKRWQLCSTTYITLWTAKGMLGVPVPEGFLEELRPSSLPIAYLERALPKADLIRFDGRRPHPINLAAVLLHDSARKRLSLATRAPSAFVRWRRRVGVPNENKVLPRTLIVASSDSRRGAEVFSVSLRDGLRRLGWLVDAVALRGSGSETRADLRVLVEPNQGSNSRFEWRVLRALRHEIRRFNPDLIIANGGSTLRYSLTAKFGLGVRVAYIGIGEPHYWIRSRLSRWVNRLMLRKTDLVLAVSEATRKQLVELEPTVERKSSTVYTGVDTRWVGLRRGDLGGHLKIVMVGSLTAEKDPFLALRAVAGIDGARLRYVGEGPLRDALACEVGLLGLTDRVEFVGSVEDVGPHLEWAHVMILTSLTEGLPGAILEASAAGVPVVAVGVGGVSEAVIDGQTGFVTTRSVDDLTDRLTRLDNDRELMRQMGENGRRYVVERFSMLDVVERYERVLRE